MNKQQKIWIAVLAVLTLTYIKLFYFPDFTLWHKSDKPQEETELEKAQEQRLEEQEQERIAEEAKNKIEEAQKVPVSVYFIGQNKNHEEVYKIVTRKFNPNEEGSKIEFVVKALLKGPDSSEKQKGIYSEVPTGTKLLSVTETANKVTIDLTSNFEQGGGTDSLYKRLYQLIKTVNKNTSKSVYLKLNGHQVDVIGGEGIMISQPLNSNSLGE